MSDESAGGRGSLGVDELPPCYRWLERQELPAGTESHTSVTDVLMLALREGADIVTGGYMIDYDL